jgi:hypothetical protein
MLLGDVGEYVGPGTPQIAAEFAKRVSTTRTGRVNE